MFEDFNKYVNRMKCELAAVDAEQSGDECAKHRKKLCIYTRYTDDLISNGFQFLDVIHHLKSELTENNFDTSSIDTGSSICEGTHSSANSVLKFYKLNIIKYDANNKFTHTIIIHSFTNYIVLCEGTVKDDLNFIRKCLESRTGMDEKAIDSLMQGNIFCKRNNSFL